MTKHMKTYSVLMITALMSIMLYSGCELGINPLLFDGSPLEAEFEINTSSTSFSASDVVDLNTAIEKISEQIDSIKVFNITLRVENTGNTPAGTTFSGSGSFDGNTLATITDVSLSTLSTEQSIFNTSGISFNQTGVSALVAAVKDAVENPGTPHPRSFSVNATSSGSPVQIKIYVKVYTQVFTSP